MTLPQITVSSSADRSDEPSMQELLASVRRMIAREDTADAHNAPAAPTEEFALATPHKILSDADSTTSTDPIAAVVESMHAPHSHADSDLAVAPDVDEEFERIGSFIRGFSRSSGHAEPSETSERATSDNDTPSVVLRERIFDDGSVLSAVSSVPQTPVFVSPAADKTLEALVLQALTPVLREAIVPHIERALPDLLERLVREVLRERI